MEVKAITRSVIISPRKLSLIADSMRGKSAMTALNDLTLTKKRGTGIIVKTLKSAMSNATKTAKEDLYIRRIEINEGASLKRFQPSTRGRAHPYKKRASHLTIILEEKGGNK